LENKNFQTRKQLIQRSIFDQTSVLVQKVTFVQSRKLHRKEFCPEKNLFMKYFLFKKDQARMENMFVFQFVFGLPFFSKQGSSLVKETSLVREVF